MTMSNAIVTITCDGCQQSIDIELTDVSQGWDDSEIDNTLKNLGWEIYMDSHTCDECVKR